MSASLPAGPRRSQADDGPSAPHDAPHDRRWLLIPVEGRRRPSDN
ncbi:hypothetical protein [Actinomyces sp. oral taxon 170]|nr:hypothetical protein [Actinomyces sp. oral taxon 170]